MRRIPTSHLRSSTALVFAAVVVALTVSEAKQDGMVVPTGGCSCHCDVADATIQLGLEGLPSEYEPEAEYPLTISFSGGPGASSFAGRQNTGGFSLYVSAGTLAALGGDTQVMEGGRGATHTLSGNDQSSWDVAWTAPPAGSGTARIALVVNSVNGDGQNDNVNGEGLCLDKWNRLEHEVPEATAPTDDGGSLSSDPSAPSDRSAVVGGAENRDAPGVRWLGAVGAAGVAFAVRRRSAR